MTDMLEGNGRRAFVTGATGFVGSNLVRELLDRGWDVTATRRPTSNLFRLSCLRIPLEVADIMDLDSLMRAIPEEADAVFHLAADLRLSDRASDEQVQTNMQGTRNLLAAAKSRKVKKVVMVSSMAAFGLHDEKIDETVTSNAEGIPIGYFRSKRLGELEADKAIEGGLDVTILNPSNVIGPFDAGNMVAIYMRLIAESKMAVTGGGSASFCHARNISAAMVNAVDRGATGERYLLGGADATFTELGELAAELTGGMPPSNILPIFRSLGQAQRISNLVGSGEYSFLTPEVALAVSHNMLVDDTKAQRDLQYTPASLRQMVTDELNWLRDRGIITPPL